MSCYELCDVSIGVLWYEGFGSSALIRSKNVCCFHFFVLVWLSALDLARTRRRHVAGGCHLG